jgi:hypothetical protein
MDDPAEGVGPMLDNLSYGELCDAWFHAMTPLQQAS